MKTGMEGVFRLNEIAGRTMRKRRFSLIAVALCAAHLLLASCGPSMGGLKPEDEKGAQRKRQGTLEGTVYYLGIACTPQTYSGMEIKIPPCNGPYPNYEIVIYNEDGTTEIAKTVSSKDGRYHLSLDPGHYIIYTPRGNGTKANSITIESRQTFDLDLVVNPAIK